MPFSSPQQANSTAVELRTGGRINEAIAAFRSGIEQFPGVLALHQNLAAVLYESGDNAGAVAAHRAALAVQDSVASHLALYELLQITGDREAALEQQLQALKTTRLFSHVAPNEERRVLCLCAPGDWQTNIPVDFLFDLQTTTVHKLYLIDESSMTVNALPAYDVIWNTIAESPTTLNAQAIASYVMRSQQKPALNSPARVLATSRPMLAQTLANTGAVVPQLVVVEREALARGSVVHVDFPMIARPIGSHAGHGLERIERAPDLAAYVQRNPAPNYFVSPFIDYSSADGYYRKYRIVFVDGVPYPVHMAISKDWMIHYYNAPMAEHQWMRDEEAAFLADPRSAFRASSFETLVKIGSAIALEYFGIDCAIDSSGAVLMFEADPAMLVHTSDPVDLYPYKQQYIPRIYRAVERMIDSRKAAR